MNTSHSLSKRGGVTARALLLPTFLLTCLAAFGGARTATAQQGEPIVSVDQTYSANVVGDYVFGTALQPDGKAIVFGSFTSVGGVAHANIARLNADGTPDIGFTASANDVIYSAAIQPDGRILVGGNFTALNGAIRNYIARLNADGTLDTTFDPNANAAVVSMACSRTGRFCLEATLPRSAGDRALISRG